MTRYFTEDIRFSFKNRRVYNRWIKHIVSSESKLLKDLNIIFCSDDYLLDINQKFLAHDYYTDIITFDYSEGNYISGDLFISIDSVRDNAKHFGVDFQTELDRVIAHGVLHLLKYDDHCDEDIKMMRAKEDHYISIIKNFYE